jgi:hypothetical protein
MENSYDEELIRLGNLFHNTLKLRRNLSSIEQASRQALLGFRPLGCPCSNAFQFPIKYEIDIECEVVWSVRDVAVDSRLEFGRKICRQRCCRRWLEHFDRFLHKLSDIADALLIHKLYLQKEKYQLSPHPGDVTGCTFMVSMLSDTAATASFGPHIGTPSRHFSARLRAERIEGKISERRSLALCIYRDRAG